MTVRMTVRQWQVLPEEDKEVLKALDILSLVKPLSSKPLSSPQPLPEPYILLKVSTCRLCETISKHYFRMLPFPGNPHALQAKEITFEDILPTDTIRKEKESCSGCFHCYRVLARETKRELIRRIIILTGRR